MLFSIAGGYQRSDGFIRVISGQLSEYVAAVETSWERFLGICRHGWPELDAVGEHHGNDGEYTLFRICGFEP